MSAFSISPKKLGRLTPGERRNLRLGLFFISPWLIGFIGYELAPVAAAFYYSLNRYDLVRPPMFLGLDNYVYLFAGDPNFYEVLWNTLFYVGIGVPVGVCVAFLIANLLNQRIVGRTFFRGVIYLPVIVPAVASAMAWQFLYNIQYGAINGILRALSLPVIPFLSNPGLAKPSLILVMVWTQGAAVVIFLAALQNVPRHLLEAASLDGASAWRKMWNVTIPMTTPIILFNLVTGFITAFQEFTIPWLLTEGGPMRATEFLLIFLYRNAFVNFRMGKASAVAWVMFLIIVVFTIILFRSSARWVYYGDEDR